MCSVSEWNGLSMIHCIINSLTQQVRCFFLAGAFGFVTTYEMLNRYTTRLEWFHTRFTILRSSTFWWLPFSEFPFFFLAIRNINMIMIFFVFPQFNNISTSRSRCKVLFGIHQNSIIYNDNRCSSIWSEGVTSFTRSRRSMGPSSSCSRYYRLIFVERYWFSTWRLTWSVPREWRTEGWWTAKFITFRNINSIVNIIFVGGDSKASRANRVHAYRKYGDE